jgi:L-asparagine transporter-like permease
MSTIVPMRKYAFRLIVFSIIVEVPALLMQLLLPECASPALPYIILFFFFITLFTLFIVLRDEQRRNGKKFISGYLLSRVIKFMSCLLFLVLYMVFNPADRWNFAVAFLIIYFCFAGFEIFALRKENSDIAKK